MDNEQLKHARKHAFRMGQQIALTERGAERDSLSSACDEFVSQFKDPLHRAFINGAVIRGKNQALGFH